MPGACSTTELNPSLGISDLVTYELAFLENSPVTTEVVEAYVSTEPEQSWAAVTSPGTDSTAVLPKHT